MDTFKLNYQPVIIIGAPRSGTNILRNVMCDLNGISTWPCDEINYIWRHGNIRYPEDTFPPELASSRVIKYIRKQFSVAAKKYSANYLVEKTCANSLRIPFVDSVFPEAKYIYIVRNGVDVVSSAIKRWRAPLDIPYIIKKAKYIPKGDIHYYAFKYLNNRFFKLTSKENRLKLWGPRISQVEKLFTKNSSIEEICATQWNECVRLSDSALKRMDKNKVHYLRYEDFVLNPKEELLKIGEFLGWDFADSTYESVVTKVSQSSIGKGQGEIGLNIIDKINPIIGQSLEMHGYKK